MPLEFLRFAPTGPRDPRETAQKCNNLGEAAARQIAAIEGRLDLLEQITVDLRPSAQGAMALLTPVTGAPDITGTFQPITFFDTVTLTPRACTLDTSTGEFTVAIAGSWRIDIVLNIAHNENNAGRETNIRVFNVTETKIGANLPIFIGRNQPGTNFAGFSGIEFAADDIGDTIRFEIGGGDTLTSVDWNVTSFLLTYLDRVSTLTDPIP